ncbi:MAG: hypothetical protein QG620_638 [Patescibacteria group bacterium]|nr:hypothetical protein [Patescibacteria group bacterium]
MDNKKIPTVLGAIVLVLIAITAGAFVYKYEKMQEQDTADYSSRRNKLPGGGVVCAQDAKICPNGLAVSRTGPNCEFAECQEDQLKTGGQCDYDKVPGTCKINSISSDRIVKFMFNPRNPLQKYKFSEILKEQQENIADDFLSDSNTKIDVGDTVNCEAGIITRGTCTPIMFRFEN